MTASLRVAVAAPIDPALFDLLQQREPRIDLLVDLELLPPRRFTADFAGDPTFRRLPNQQRRFEHLLRDGDAIFGIPDLDPGLLAATVRASPRLRWVHTMAAGGGSQVRAAGLTADELARVIFTTSAGVHGRPLAEFAAFGILAAAKSLPRLLEQKRARRWSGRWPMGQVAGQNALVLGFGGVGAAVAVLLHSLGMRVSVLSRSTREHDAVDRFVRPEDLLTAAGRADAIIQTLPGTDATENMLDAAFFAAVKRGVTFVNVGRGSVVSEEALIHSLSDGRVGFAALDVFTHEPLAEDNPLWTFPNVLISPHTAALTAHEERDIVELFARNATRLIDGLPLENRVDTVEFY